MTGYRRPGSDRIRRRNRIIAAACAALAVALIALIVVLIVRHAGKQGDDVTAPPAATAAPTPTAAPPTQAPTAQPTAAPTQQAGQGKYNVVNPTPVAEGFMPIFAKAQTSDKIIAVTVDDFYQFDNAREIIDIAVENGAKLTLFPIGKNVLRKELHDTMVYAYESGMEIENHTYEHDEGLYRMDDETMAKHVFLQALAVKHVLGLDYQEHFFRPKGGDGRTDQRTHQYIKQLGFKGIAHWSMSGSSTDIDKLVSTIEPGNIYLFHTTDNDTVKLRRFIPEAVAQGYTLVTLNEMFGFPDNEVSELTKPVKEWEIPQLEEFTLVPRTYKEGDYIWQVNLIQQRLAELGYLEVEPDGIFGKSTTAAVREFQQANGLKANGKANVDTQNALFSDDAVKKK